MRRGAGRGGYILIYVLVLSLVMGALVLAYQESFRQRNVQVRLNTDRVSARFLARAAIDALRWAFREAPDPARLAGELDLESGPILPFLLADAPSLTRRLQRKAGEGADHRALLEQLLGSEALAGVDRLAGEVAGAQVAVYADFAPAAPKPGPVRDPALKTIALTLKAVARVRKAVEAYAFAETLTVWSQLPVAAKFTLAGLDLKSVNGERITTDGRAGDGPPPVVLFHAPADCDVLAATPFEGTPGSEKPLVERSVVPRELIHTYGDRGFVYLDSSEPDRAVKLNVGAGGTPFGEMHAVYRPESGKVHAPQPAPLPDPPGRLASFRAASPVNPDVKQSAVLEGAAYGFSRETNRDGALRPLPAASVAAPGPGYEQPDAEPETPPEGEASEAPPPPPPAPAGAPEDLAASRIKPYGTGTFPSPTIVLGNVQRAVAWIANLGIDRDATPDDENAQATAAGRKLPEADAHEPVLVQCDEATFRADVAGEGATVVSYRRLHAFGDQGSVTNHNAYYDANNTGVADTPVPGEDPTFALDLTLWKYGALFDDYRQYAAVMSRELAYPANLSLHLPALAPAQAAELLRNLALGRAAGVAVDEYALKDARVECRDRLHARMDAKVWLDLKGAGPDGLRNALVEGLERRHPGDDAVVVRGQGELERTFFSGGSLDLKGLRVRVVGEREGQPSAVRWTGALAVKPGSGGVLEVDRFEATGIANPGGPGEFAPFTLKAKELVLAGKGPYEALIATSKIMQEDFRSYAVIRGALFAQEPELELKYPLVVTYDPRLDPTGEGAQQQYRVALQPGARGYDLLERP